MKKVYFLWTTFVFVLSASLAFGQSLNEDLQSFFRNFHVESFSTDELKFFTEAGHLTLRAGDVEFTAQLRRRDLRSARYYAEASTAQGTIRLQPNNDVHTFSGKIQNQPNSQVRLTIENEKIEGYFLSENGEMYFIEPANRYSSLADKSEFVIYRKQDILNPQVTECLAEKMERRSLDIVGSASFISFRVIEIATEADFEYVNALGGASQANNEILSILNMVEGAYEQQLGLTLSVVYQHAWTTQDPFDGTSTNSLLESFRNYWNANQTSVARDTAHLWSGKQNALSRGLAYIGVVCSNTSFTYGLSGKIDFVPVKFTLTAHEIGHNLNATHADEPQGCANTIMNTTLTTTTPLVFCEFSKNEIRNYVSANNACLSQKLLDFDFDGDGRSDLAVFRPSNGVWFILNSSNGSLTATQFGLSNDKLVPADYDGDGRTDIAVFRNGVWYVLRSSNSTFNVVYFGTTEDIPAPADFDGDRRSDINVFRPSTGTWFRIQSSDNRVLATQFGSSGDIPLPADYDGDGRADINLWRPSNGVWYRLNSSNGSFTAIQFGGSAFGDKPVVGDFDGDSKADLAVWRASNGTWYILRSSNNSLYAMQFGISTDIPAPADFTGDGRTDLCVFRNGVWHRFSIPNSSYSAFQFGLSGDRPAQAYYVP